MRYFDTRTLRQINWVNQIKKNNKYRLCNSNLHYSCIGYANKTIKKFLNIAINKKSSKIISPGMLKKHYSPGIPVILNQKRADKNCALITIGKLQFFRNDEAVFEFEKISNLAVGILYFSQSFFVKIFEPSSCDAILFGPKTLILNFSR